MRRFSRLKRIAGYQQSIAGPGKGYEAYETNLARLRLIRRDLLNDGQLLRAAGGPNRHNQPATDLGLLHQ